MISFIIPAWNEEALIGCTLERVRAAADSLGEPYEIIVADDASTDRTGEIAREHGAELIRVEKRQIAAVRNAGAAIARGRFFFFIDADTLVPAKTLAEAWHALEDGAVGGGAPFVLEGRIPWQFRIYLFLFMVVWRPLRSAVGCFAFARRDEFEAIGGWDETYFAGEELYFSRALQRRGRFVLVRTPVVSSGRKARLLRTSEFVRLLLRALRRGSKTLKQREGLEAWYVPLREETEHKSR